VKHFQTIDRIKCKQNEVVSKLGAAAGSGQHFVLLINLECFIRRDNFGKLGREAVGLLAALLVVVF